MNFTPNSLKWALRLYPPFLLQRIWVEKIMDGYKGIDIKIRKSFLNINSNKTLFGGTIFSALDPVHPILIDQIFKSRGMVRTVAWLKSAKINYLKPGRTDLTISIRLTDIEVEEAYQTILREGKFIRTFVTEVFDKKGELCATSQNEIYIRDLSFKKNIIKDQNLTIT